MLLGVWVSLPPVEAKVTSNEVSKGHMDGEALFADPDDVIHAKITQLVQHQ